MHLSIGHKEKRAELNQLVLYCLSLSLFQALAKFQTTTKLTTKSGIEQEESLLCESAARETSLQTQIIDLENETKLVFTKFIIIIAL